MAKDRNGAKAEPAYPRLVLMMDDRPDRLQPLKTALTGAGYNVETACGAEDAYARLSARRPDAMVLGLHLPDSTGLTLAERLLVDVEFAAVPIIGLILESDAGNPCSDAGDLFDGLARAPLEPEEVVRQIQSSLAEATPSAETPGTADAGDQAEDILQQILTGLPESQFAPGTAVRLQALSEAAGDGGSLPDYLRRAGILARAHTARGRAGFSLLVRLCREVASRGPDPAPEFEELRTQYLENRSAELGALARAVHSSDFAALAKAGHNLKGTGAAYGFAELTELGRALEMAAKATDGVQVEAVLDRTNLYLSLVRTALADG